VKEKCNAWRMLVGVLGWLALPISAAATGPFDGSKPLVCAVTDADQCEEEGACLDGDADDLHAAELVRVDVKGKTIQILDDGREGEKTAIQHVERQEGRLFLQGVEAGRGWTMLLSEETGDTTLVVADDGVAFVLYGACTTL
jgi:hypothetical protein